MQPLIEEYYIQSNSGQYFKKDMLIGCWVSSSQEATSYSPLERAQEVSSALEKFYKVDCVLVMRKKKVKPMIYEDNITKEILDTIKVGNLIRVNDWKKPMRVVGVSENYFIMICNNFGKLHYSVCEKKAWNGIRYNKMIGGMCHCGVDNMIFGWHGFDYKFDDQEQIDKYLQAFESGEVKLSMRRGTIPIHKLNVKE